MAENTKLSSKDKIADGKLDRAISMIKEISPIIAVADPAKGDPSNADKTIKNIDTVMDLTIVESLDEIVQLVVEAAELWSELRAGEKAEAVIQWFKELTDLLVATDQVLTLHLIATASKHIEDLDACEGLPSEQNLNNLGKTIREQIIDSSPWDGFNTRLRGIIEGLPKHILGASDCAGLVDSIDTLEESLIARASHRQEALAVFTTIASLGKSPGSVEDAIADWQSAQNKGQGDTA